MVVVPKLRNGGCLNFVDPELGFIEDILFWSPAVCPHVLWADFYIERHGPDPIILDLDALDCEIHTLLQPPDTIHYLFKKGQHSIQIACQDRLGNEPKICRCGCLKLILLSGINSRRREAILSTKKVIYMAENKCFPNGLFKTCCTSDKFYMKLGAIEDLYQNYPHKEIAVNFFPKEEVEVQWPDLGSHVRVTMHNEMKSINLLTANEGHIKYLSRVDS